MKRMILMIAMITGAGFAAQAQTSTPVYLNNGANDQQVNVYANHGEQGNAMYHNNAQWYNKDNVTPGNSFPATNGQYIQPGNSNPINNRMYDGNIISGGTQYGTSVPATDAGTYPNSGSEAYIRD